MRDKLIALIQNAVGGCARHWAELIADALIANGATFAECLVDTNKTSPMTNGDRIRAMSDERMATFLDCVSSCAVCREAERLDDNPLLRNENCDGDCESHILEWLKQPVKS